MTDLEDLSTAEIPLPACAYHCCRNHMVHALFCSLHKDHQIITSISHHKSLGLNFQMSSLDFYYGRTYVRSYVSPWSMYRHRMHAPRFSALSSVEENEHLHMSSKNTIPCIQPIVECSLLPPQCEKNAPKMQVYPAMPDCTTLPYPLNAFAMLSELKKSPRVVCTALLDL